LSARDKRDVLLALVGLGLPQRDATRRIEAALLGDPSRVWEAGELAAAALRLGP